MTYKKTLGKLGTTITAMALWADVALKNQDLTSFLVSEAGLYLRNYSGVTGSISDIIFLQIKL